MKQNSESNQLITRDNNKSQKYRNKTVEELSDIELEIETFVNDNTEDKKANLIKGEIVDVDFNKEAGKITFTVEFEGNRGKFTIDDFIEKETDSKSDKIKSLENRAGARIEDTSKFFNQQLYIIRHKSGQLYGFIPKLRHKLTYTIFGYSCINNGDYIFPGKALFGMLFGLAASLVAVAEGIMMGAGLLHTVLITAIYGLSLFIIGLMLGAAIGSFMNESIHDKSVYEISEIE
jgi:hypothetical protein